MLLDHGLKRGHTNVATDLRLPISTVRVRLFRARELLRESLSDLLGGVS